MNQKRKPEYISAALASQEKKEAHTDLSCTPLIHPQ